MKIYEKKCKDGFPCLRIPARLESCYTNVRFDGNFSPTCRSILSLNSSKILWTEPFQVVLLLSSGFFYGSLLFSMENAPQNYVLILQVFFSTYHNTVNFDLHKHIVGFSSMCSFMFADHDGTHPMLPTNLAPAPILNRRSKLNSRRAGPKHYLSWLCPWAPLLLHNTKTSGDSNYTSKFTLQIHFFNTLHHLLTRVGVESKFWGILWITPTTPLLRSTTTSIYSLI